jgi:methyl-accepting chemotaxis protein
MYRQPTTPIADHYDGTVLVSGGTVPQRVGTRLFHLRIITDSFRNSLIPIFNSCVTCPAQRQSAGAVEQTGQRTGKSIAEIESLAATTQRIDGVLTLIRAIAEQTNLLALNATIEAARAGEAGRGFAVVAHEVKALAGQTAKATEEIGQNVSLIQTSTKNAVDAVREIGGAVQDINNITSNIASAVEQQDSATRQISVNAQSAAQGNQTLVANIASLRDAIGETDSAAASVLTASDELTSTAETLSREVEKFFRNLRSETARPGKAA